MIATHTALIEWALERAPGETLLVWGGLVAGGVLALWWFGWRKER